MINKIDFIITTMDRYDRLEMLLDSIYKYYPEAKVTVADQSKVIDYKFYKKYKIDLLSLKHDCGLSYARNELIKMTQRPYILLLEDDFLFTEETNIEKLYELMEVSDIAGGGVYQNDIRIPFEFNFKENGDTLEHVSDGDKIEELYTVEYNEEVHLANYKQTQCILNFFLAKRLVFNDILWYDKLKLAEHQHFFYRLSRETDCKVVYTPDVKIVDNKIQGQQSPHYTALRTRQEFFAEAIRDLGFKRIKYLNGTVAEANGNNIKYYKEL